MKLRSLNRQQLTWLGTILAALALIGYIWFYQFSPFSDFVNDLALNLITIFSALACAALLTLVASFFERGEPSKIIWINFALGAWMWTLGEIIWASYNMTVVEPPMVSLADGVWMLGYVFFTLAITTQFRLVMFGKGNRPVWVAIGAWVLSILTTFAILILTVGQPFSEEFFTYFYPVGDLAIGAASILLVIVFHNGVLARPWLGLLIFAFSDGLYAWATISGLYAYASTEGNLISLIIDLTYILAYLAVAWGAFHQYLTLRFGAAVPERGKSQSAL